MASMKQVDEWLCEILSMFIQKDGGVRMKFFKLYNENHAKNGCWFGVANEREKGKINDDDVYHYLDDGINLDEIKEGDILELDENFQVLEIDEVLK